MSTRTFVPFEQDSRRRVRHPAQNELEVIDARAVL